MVPSKQREFLSSEILKLCQALSCSARYEVSERKFKKAIEELLDLYLKELGIKNE